MINLTFPQNEDFTKAPVFEIEKALNRVHNKKELLERVIEIFVKSLDEKKDIIENELDNENWETLGTIAHSIKGSSWTIGAQQLGNIAYQMEKTAAKKDLDLFRQLFQVFQTAMKEFRDMDKTM
jgi:HPt (histidine-containing phosphotransfer) domain-containing protein